MASYVSHDAGRYLCNASYFQALDTPVPVVFIHIPRIPGAAVPRAGRHATDAVRRRRTWSERLGDALVEIGVLLLRESRNRRPR